MTDLEKQVLSYIDEQREGIVSYLRKLVNIDTHVPPGLNYDKICTIMAEKLGQCGCDVNIHNATEKYLKMSGEDFLGLKGPRSNVVAKYKGRTGNPVLHVSAHIDTAAIQAEGWTVDPLEGKVTKDNPYGTSPFYKGSGYIWGRGTSDDKGECTAMTYVVEALHELGVKLKGDLILTGNCDEEIGGVAGLGYLIKEGIVKADYGIQLDGGISGIGLGTQGRARFIVRTVGKSSHGQVPLLGINAIEKMSKINVALNDYWRNVLLRKQKAVVGIELEEREELKEVGIDNFTAMLNIGTIKGGIQAATVPDRCEEEVLITMIPGENIHDLQNEIKSVIEGVKATDSDLKYELELINVREGCLMSPQHPYIQEIKGIVKEVIGRELPFIGTLSSTDINYQVNDGKMPCFNFGVGGPYSNVHKQDESAAIDEIVECARIVALVVMRKLGVQ